MYVFVNQGITTQGVTGCIGGQVDGREGEREGEGGRQEDKKTKKESDATLLGIRMVSEFQKPFCKPDLPPSI